MLFSLEALIYREAEALIALSPAIAATLEGKYQINRSTLFRTCRIVVLLSHATASKTEGLFGGRDKFVISYIGALGIANGLERMLVCAVRCSAIHLFNF